MHSGYLSALTSLDYIGIAVFAVSGALVAAEKRLDLVTFCFFAVITGVGGGTVRDLLIGAPVFWIHENWIVLICLSAALVVWLTPVTLVPARALLWADAIGIAVYASYGAAKGLAYNVAPVPAIGMGVLTACLGGILRDLLADEPSVLLRRELYVTAAVASASLMVALELMGVAEFASAAIAAALGFALRAGAIVKGWSLPTYRR